MKPITTPNFRVSLLSDRLIVRRRKIGPFKSLLATLFALALAGIVPFFGIFVYHYHIIASSCFLGGMTLYAFVGIWDAVRRLSPKPVLLDRLRNQVIVNDQCLFALTDLSRVVVDKYYFRARKASCKMVQLRLVAAGGQCYTVQESVTYNVEEAEVVGQAIADFACAEFVSLVA